MRLTEHQYFMEITKLVARRSTCIRRQVGSIAVIDKRIIATGYNGAVSGMTHCTPETCYRHLHNIPSGEKLDHCLAVHAEQNLLTQAAIHGVSIKDATVYVTTTPCLTCLKLLAQIGVKDIFCGNGDYPQLDLAKKICLEKGITIHFLDKK
ncbi:MAG: dCMP deaminase family protein [Desulfovibrio sp.]|nr:dCMP deaminase family protein [Desulfovibrio sp.]